MSIRNLKQKIPIFDRKTQWCSSCGMIGRLLELRNFCEGISAGNSDVNLTVDQWNRLKTIFEAQLRLLQKYNLEVLFFIILLMVYFS
jgi:hypothetical protein